MQKYFYIIALILIFPMTAGAQEFNSDELKRLERKEKKVVYVSQKSISAIQKVNAMGKERVQEALDIILALREKNLDKNDQVLTATLIGNYHLQIGNNDAALEEFLFLLNHERVTKSMELGAVISLSIIYYNKKEYLNSIRYANLWSIYNVTKMHQTSYMLAANYLAIGDYENSFKTYVAAKEIHDKFLEDGPDFSEPIGITGYDEMVKRLDAQFGSLSSSQVSENNITIDIPPPGDAYWLIKFNPKFPSAALRRGRTGQATMKFDIDSKGKLHNVEIIDTSNSIFKRSAKSHSRKMVYIRYAQSSEEFIAQDVVYTLEFIYEG